MKRFLILTLLFFLLVPAFAQRPKVGVVLSGGGAKGAAHVGALKVLEEYGIPIDMIVGTSMGAIVGGLYAIGYSASELDSLIMAQDWNVVMSDRIPRNERFFERKKEAEKYLIRVPFGAGDYSRLGARAPRKTDETASFLSNIPLALVNGQNVYNLFTQLSVGYQDSLDFNRMPIPFACVAVDLVKKKEVVFHSGHFVDAIRSSMAIPAYFSPVRLGDMVLIDGGAVNNYPVDVARAMGADIIIGVRLGEPSDEDPTIENIGDMFGQMLDLFLDTKLQAAIEDTDILITADTKGYGVLSFDDASLRTLIDNGEAAARGKEEELKKMKDFLDRSQQHFIGPIKQPDRYRKAIRLDRDSITLGNVSFNGISVKDAQLLFRKSCLKPGARISGKMIEEEISRFYNTSAFESVTYLLKGTEEPFDLELNFVQGRKSVLGVGVRFDSEEIAAILATVSFRENALYGSKFLISAKLAYNLQTRLQYTYAFKSQVQCNTAYTFRSSDLNIMNSGYRSNLDFDQHSIVTDFATDKFRDLHITLGARMDFFKYNSLLKEEEAPPTYNTDLKRNKFFSVFGRVQVDRRDNSYFPTRGFEMDGSFRYFIESPFDDYNNFSVARLHLSGAIPLAPRMALVMSLDNRSILGNQTPLIYGNVLGGYLPGRYLDHQIPFIGFAYTHVFRNFLTTATLDARYRMLDNHYFYASGSYGLDFQKLSDIKEDHGFWGVRAGYAYNSFFGPLSANLFYSSFTHRVGVYVSLGYNF